MQNFVRLARSAGARVSAGTAGAVAATTLATPSSAHAYEQPNTGLRNRFLEQAWQLTDVKDADQIIFRAEDIDEAAGRLCRPDQCTTIITEVDSSDGTSITSDGEHADEEIELAGDDVRYAEDAAGQFPAVLQVATRLLKQPGVQRAVCHAMVEDPDIMDILARELGRDNLESYLAHTGFAAQGLLTGPDEDGSTAAAAQQNAAPAKPAAAVDDPLVALGLHIARGLEAAGETMARLGGWIRTRLMGPEMPRGAAAAGPRRGLHAKRFFGSVMVVMVAIVATMVLKRPVVLTRMFRA